MQSTGDFHDEIVIHFLGIAEEIFDNVTAFDASNGSSAKITLCL